jgi:hypothetical protein
MNGIVPGRGLMDLAANGLCVFFVIEDKYWSLILQFHCMIFICCADIRRLFWVILLVQIRQLRSKFLHVKPLVSNLLASVF